MKDAIHPTYYPNATVHCSGCDRTFHVGSTEEKINVELCSNCHPFYTGKQKLVDTAGRVDRFRARQAKAAKKAAPVPDADVEVADSADPSTEERLVEMKKTLQSDD